MSLEQRGIDETPRFLGEAADGRNMFSFIEGSVTLWPNPRAKLLQSNELLAKVSKLMCRLRAATEEFASMPRQWQENVPLPDAVFGGRQVICHNDHGPWNTVVRGDLPVGLIDRDMAGPGHPMWDIACGLWHWVPFYADREILASGWEAIPDRVERTSLFLDSYGMRMTIGMALD